MPHAQQSMDICACCSGPAKLYCSRCSDSYCSLECQRKDWNLHRHICFKMPTLFPKFGSLESKMSSLVVSTPDSHVIENHVQQPLPVATIERSFSEETEPPKMVASRDPEEVTEVVKKTIPISNHVDGKTAKADDDAMKPIKQPRPLKVPSVVGVPVKYNQAGSVTGKPEIERKKPETFVKPAPAKPSRVMFTDLALAEWDNAKNIKAAVLNLAPPNILTLREESKELNAYYEHITTEIAKYCSGKKHADYKPVLNEIVLAMFEDDWYRATVIDPNENGIIVQFTDFGNIEPIKAGQLMPISEDLMFDICARDFIVDNCTDFQTMSDKQREIFSSGILTITNIRKDADGLFHCDIFGF